MPGNSEPAEDISLILADLPSSSRSGHELATELKSRPGFSEVPVILLTHVGRLDNGLQTQSDGVVRYLTKPVRRDDLYKAICGVLDPAREGMEPDVPPPAAPHPTLEADRSKMKILVVEDYPINQVIVREHLASAGYQVDLAENGREAVEAFREKRFDLILMDIEMPVMDGYEAVRTIRTLEDQQGPQVCASGNERKRTPIVAMTAHAFKGYREKCLQAGMDNYITKPIRRAELLELVDGWIPTMGRSGPSEEPSTVAEGENRRPGQGEPTVLSAETASIDTPG